MVSNEDSRTVLKVKFGKHKCGIPNRGSGISSYSIGLALCKSTSELSDILAPEVNWNAQETEDAC